MKRKNLLQGCVCVPSDVVFYDALDTLATRNVSKEYCLSKEYSTELTQSNLHYLLRDGQLSRKRLERTGGLDSRTRSCPLAKKRKTQSLEALFYVAIKLDRILPK